MEWLTAPWPVGVATAALVAAIGVIGVAGVRLARTADRLADVTGLGEAAVGAVLLGGATSLAGLTVSVVAAVSDDPSLAVTNSLGGIAIQTAFLVVADITYRDVNLEHVAASLPNMFNSLLLVMLLGLVAVAANGPDLAWFGVHPVSVLLVVVYVYGIRVSQRIRNEPMWRPTPTEEHANARTGPETPAGEGEEASSPARLLGTSALLGGIVAVAGFVVGRAGISLSVATGITGTVIGTFLTSVSTSVPELVTTVAAVRRGATTLAVAGIVGGNAFDILFIAASDIAYRPGGIYQALTSADQFVVGWAILLTTLVTAGLIRRGRRGIGFEGYSVLVVYLLGFLTLTLAL